MQFEYLVYRDNEREPIAGFRFLQDAKPYAMLLANSPGSTDAYAVQTKSGWVVWDSVNDQ